MISGSNGVVLRSFEKDDAKQLAKLANNKNVWDNLRDYIPFPYSEKDATEFIEFCLSLNPITNFAIEYNGELAGSIGLIPQRDVYRKSAEIGYWIGEPFWGKGIVTEAVRLITDYGFDNLDIVRIFTGVFAYNHASRKVLEKNGFKEEGVFEKSVYKNNEFHDEVRFGKVK